MRSMLALALLAGLGWSGVCGSAAAQAFEGGGLEVTRFRAMGGVNVANDARTPANAAIERTKQTTILDVHLGLTASDGLDVRNKAEDVFALDLAPASMSDEDLLAYAEQLDRLNDIFDNQDVAVRVDTRIDLGRHVRPIGEDGSLEFSFYMQSQSWGIGRPPLQLDDDELYEDGLGTYLDLGEDIELVRVDARAQAGMYVGYGHRIELSHRRALGVGARLRGFAQADMAPMLASAPRRVYGPENVIYDDEPEYEIGGGFALDLYGSFDFADKLLNTRLALRAESAPSWVSNGGGRVQTPAVAVGAIIHPLHVLKLDALQVGVDLENFASGEVPTVQMGASYHFGFRRWFYIQPMIGAQFGADGVVPVNDNRMFSVGFDSLLGVVMFAGAVNVAPQRYDLAFSLGFGW